MTKQDESNRYAKEWHPEFTLQDMARGRCPYCRASADMDCNCQED